MNLIISIFSVGRRWVKGRGEKEIDIRQIHNILLSTTSSISSAVWFDLHTDASARIPFHSIPAQGKATHGTKKYYISNIFYLRLGSTFSSQPFYSSLHCQFAATIFARHLARAATHDSILINNIIIVVNWNLFCIRNAIWKFGVFGNMPSSPPTALACWLFSLRFPSSIHRNLHAFRLVWRIFLTDTSSCLIMIEIIVLHRATLARSHNISPPQWKQRGKKANHNSGQQVFIIII